jgi:hypothetical protein
VWGRRRRSVDESKMRLRFGQIGGAANHVHRSRASLRFPNDGTFEQARADFEAAWAAYLPRCTPADFEEYRHQRAWTAWKYTAAADTFTRRT